MAGLINKLRSRRQKDFTDDIPGGERPRYDTDSGGSFAPAGSPVPEKAAGFGGRRIGTAYPKRSVSAYGGIKKPSLPKGVYAPADVNAEGTANDDGFPKRELPTAETNGTGVQTDSGQQTESGAQTYDYESTISDFYNRLYEKLRAYGITDIPSFNELYGLFESFLRPAIDAAILERQRAGRANAAQLDADAYARGMGGSSYLSSMKARENANVASDVMALEGKYSASMAEYLYKALETMQKIESELAKTRMTLAAAHSGSSSGKSSGSHGRSGKTGGSSTQETDTVPYGHNKNGAYFDGVWYDGDFSYLDKDYTYTDYARYLNGLSPSERYLFFTSDSREWRIRRWQVQYNLPQVDYMDLYASYMPSSAAVGGGHHDPGFGGNLWQPIQY